MEVRGRITKFANLTNAVRNANEIGQNSTFIAGYTREERTTEGFGIGEDDY